MDETATGSANFFGPVRLGSAVVHFHPPSIDPGIIALVWALALGTFIYFGLLAVGTSGAFASERLSGGAELVTRRPIR